MIVKFISHWFTLIINYDVNKYVNVKLMSFDSLFFHDNFMLLLISTTKPINYPR